ncbi:MAG: hypothetical protein JHC95_03135 [Solirubrobacteraceae bacterium]|nr:hypothetical protein [Solirubrobacteraceae bacterium]
MTAVPAPTTAARGGMLDRTLARAGLDRVEGALLAALALLSVAVLIPLLAKGRTITGADGLLAADQLQYLTWIREASHHLLIGNLFDLAPGDRPFLHPLFAISGGLVALGFSLPVAYLALWKPVAVLVLFFGTQRYVRRFLPETGPRHTALVLALFGVMPASWIVAFSGWGGKPREYSFDFISGEMFSGGWLWGYLPTAIAVGLVPLVLLGVERWRRDESRAMPWLTAAGALLVCWLQPWQGAELGLILVGVEAWRWRRDGERPRLGLIAVLGGIAIPAFYYLALSHFDPAWELAGEANARGAMEAWRWPWWAIVLVLLPLAVPAALAYLKIPATSWQDQAVRIWPFAILAVYLLPVGTFPYHAFQGLAIPLAILAVQGSLTVWRTPKPAIVVGLLLLMTVPGIAHKLDVARNSIQSAGDPYWIFDGERAAMRALEDDPRPGGVLGASYAGYMLPAYTGRETYVGAMSWSPDWTERQRPANALVEGRLTGQEARDFVTSTNARFVFVDCRPNLAELTETLGPLLEAKRQYGCATVYELKARPEMARAAGAPDA